MKLQWFSTFENHKRNQKPSGNICISKNWEMKVSAETKLKNPALYNGEDLL